MTQDTGTEIFDAVVVGGRVAGAATALMLARAGAKVLIAERDAEIGDTLSTHALMRPGVALLGKLGLLERLIDAGVPVVNRTRFHYGPEVIDIPVKPMDGVPGLIAPRRWLLDKVIIEAAAEAGAELRLATGFETCLRDEAGRVTGAVLHDRSGREYRVHAKLVIGADGRLSQVASDVGAEKIVQSPNRAATVYGYFPGVQEDGYRWYFGERVAAGVIPTNDGRHCIFTSVHPLAFMEHFGADLLGGMASILSRWDEGLAAHVATSEPDGKLRRFLGAPGHIRACAGPGWALVGDAGYFKDPATAHGITDALLDAERLARSFLDTGTAESYQRERNAHALSLFAATQEIAGFG
ncbi:MAG: FAD-dependent monooxygenase [Tepidamorphaceae bacterium]